MVSAVKSLVGLVRSGALKHGFDMHIYFTKGASVVVAKKRIYSADKAAVFLNNLFNDLKELKDNPDLTKLSGESQSRIKSLFSEGDLDRILKDNLFDILYETTLLKLITKKKDYDIKINNKMINFANKVKSKLE